MKIPHPITGEIQVKHKQVGDIFFQLSSNHSHTAFFHSFFFSQLQINYDRNLGNLIVHVLQARNLAQRDNDGYSDPFVKVYLLPGRGWALHLFESLQMSGLCLPFCFCVCLVFSPCISFFLCIDCAIWNWLTVCMREWDWTWWHEAVICSVIWFSLYESIHGCFRCYTKLWEEIPYHTAALQ